MGGLGASRNPPLCGGIGTRTAGYTALTRPVLVVAIAPVHVHMALYPQVSEAALWARLPRQGLLIAWAYWFTRPRPSDTERRTFAEMN